MRHAARETWPKATGNVGARRWRLLRTLDGQPLSDAAIVERIVAAVMEQKLPAGAKLPEGALCEVFECSRTQIRRILVVLAERGVVTLHVNRGAFVSSPRRARRRATFSRRAARSSGPIVLSAAARIGRSALEELRANVAAGSAAEARGDRSSRSGFPANSIFSSPKSPAIRS